MFSSNSWLLSTIISLLGLSITEILAWNCVDVLQPSSRCQELKDNGYCHRTSVFKACQSTCGHCDDSWTNWSQWSDCSAASCSYAGQRTKVRQCKTLIPCIGPTVKVQACTRSNCADDRIEATCNEEEFLCPGTKDEEDQNCLPKRWICDGYNDCIDDSDEIDCLLGDGPTDGFLILSGQAVDVSWCMQAKTNGSVILAWHCPTTFAPYYNLFKWKWHRIHNLRNIESGKCMAKDINSTMVIMVECNHTDSLQLWECLNNRTLGLINSSDSNRHVHVDSDNGYLFMSNIHSSDIWVFGGTNDTICSWKRTWQNWGQWSECSTTCLGLGIGLRSRQRVCNRGDPGRGLCEDSGTETEQCDSPACRPHCPAGFDNSSFAWACFKVIEKPANLTEARKGCQNMSVQGVSLRAKLAADKEKNNQVILRNLIDEAGFSDAYVGLGAAIADGEMVNFQYSNDGGVIGKLKISRFWHNISINVTQGWPGSKGSQFYIVSALGLCLDLNTTTNQAVMVDCIEASLWRYSLKFLMHTPTGLCLARNLKSINDSEPEFEVGGERCNMKDPDQDLLWVLHDENILPSNSTQQLSVQNTSLVFHEPMLTRWYASTEYNGPTDLHVCRDWHGDWFSIYEVTSELCMGISEDTEIGELSVIMKPCDASDTTQRWSSLWTEHIFNRHFAMCLRSPASGRHYRKELVNDTSVVIGYCDRSDRWQKWIKTGVLIDEESFTKYASKQAKNLFLQSACSQDFPDADNHRVCVGNTGRERDGVHRLLDHAGQVSSDEVFMIHSVLVGKEDYCLMAEIEDDICNDTEVRFAPCSEEFKDRAWWRWAGAGSAIVNIASVITRCCLTATEDKGLIVQNCPTNDNLNENQLWRVIKFQIGVQIALATDNALVISLNEIPDTLNGSYKSHENVNVQVYNYFPFNPKVNETDDSVGVSDDAAIILRNLNESKWLITESFDAHGMLPVMKDCWQKGQTSYHGLKSWTKGGLLCQSWRRQSPHPHTYPISEGPFCRNPPSYREDGTLPWCLTMDHETRWESCHLPSCPDKLGVVLSAESGSWSVTGGIRKLPYVCEAPSECINGSGFGYQGTVNTSWSGKPCLNWLERQINLGQLHSGVISPNHSFCRNPDRDESGPWCWVSDRKSERCKHIQRCPILCSPPPELFRGHIVGIFHTGPGLLYANGSKVLYGCQKGRMRSAETVTTNNITYDLICLNGIWSGLVPACNVLTCDVSKIGVKNASPLSQSSSVPYKNNITYKCDPGYLMETGVDNITLTCVDNNTWTTEWLPIRLIRVNPKHIESLSSLSCTKPCPPGFTPVGHWCIKVVESNTSYAVHSDSLECPSPSEMVPLEVAIAPDMIEMISSLSKEQFQLGVSQVLNSSLDNDRFRALTEADISFRSRLTGKLLTSDLDYVAAKFQIKSTETFSVNGSSPVHFCLTIDASNDSVFQECPNNWKNLTFLFHWISGGHIMHTESKLCLQATLFSYNNFLFEPSECIKLTRGQHWVCDGDKLKYTFDYNNNRFLQLEFIDDKPIAKLVSDVDDASSFYPGDRFVALMDPYRNESFCSQSLKPQYLVFVGSCYNKTASSFLDTRQCNINESDSTCSQYESKHFQQRSSLFFVSSQAEYLHSCKCGWIANEGKAYFKMHHSDICNMYRIGLHDCTSNNREPYGAWCYHGLSEDYMNPTNRHIGYWCLMIRTSVNSTFSQVIETPCDAMVTEKLCAVRAQYPCPQPPSRIIDGYRFTPGERVPFENNIFLTGNISTVITGYVYESAVVYKCEPGYRFSDGSEQQKIFCLMDGKWSLDLRLLKCHSRFCSRPADPAYAHPLTLPKGEDRVAVGTSLQVTCHSGYVVRHNELSQTSVCNLGGVWEPPLAACQTMLCPPPPNLAGMKVIGNVFRLHSIITYKCEFGKHLVLSSGEVVPESHHKCDASGQWLPSPTVLQCEDTVCPTPRNVLSSVGKGVGQAITIGCMHGDSLYNHSKLVLSGRAKAICGPEGKWIPSIAGLKCDYTPCPLPPGDVINATMINWRNTIAKYQNKRDAPVHEAKAEYFCKEAHHTTHHFSIYVSSHLDGGCLQAYAHDSKVSVADEALCDSGDDATLFWQWFPQDTRLLYHVVSGHCLASSSPIGDISSTGFSSVALEKCVTTDERQQWTCYARKQVDLYLGLANQVDRRHGELAVLRYSPPLKGAIVSTSQQGVASEWSLNDGSNLCVMKPNDMKTTLKCARHGQWVPAADHLSCIYTNCVIPSNRSDITFHNAFTPEGKSIPSHRLGNMLKYGSTIYASCKEGYKVRDLHKEGKLSSVRIRCSSMGEWAPSLKHMHCDAITCQPLAGVIANAILLHDTSWGYLSMVKVVCREGMWFEDIRRPSRKLACGRDGAWSWPPSQVNCTDVRCPRHPQVPANGFILSESRAHHYDDARIMQCDRGYWFSRYKFNEVVRCIENGTWHPDVRCKPVTCIDPPPFINFGSMLSETRHGWTVGSKAVYQCKHHRNFAGTQNKTLLVTCGSNGRWAPDPALLGCHLYGCLSAKEMQADNPYAGISGGHSNVGAELNIACEKGYLMRNGQATTNAVCRADRKWYPPLDALRCLPVNCRGNPPDVPNASILAKDGYTYGSVATVKCDTEFNLEGLNAVLSVEIQCDFKGEWVPDPKLLNCTPVTCFDPPAKTNSVFTRSNSNTKLAELGDQALVSCIEGYWFNTLVYDTVVSCNASGLWSPDPFGLDCTPVECFDPGFLLYSTRGLVVGIQIVDLNPDEERFRFRQQLEYRCTAGFWLSFGIAQQRTMCQKSGQWTHSVLKPCAPVTCSKLPILKHADIITVDEAQSGAHAAGVVITYKCRDGWQFENNASLPTRSKNVTCSSHGEWEPSPYQRKCAPVVCPPFPGNHKNDSSNNEYESVVTVQCLKGYVLANSQNEKVKMTCNKEGKWEPAFAEELCMRLDCGEPPFERNTDMTIQDGTLYNDIAIYNCKQGMKVSLSDTSWNVRCSHDGTWVPHDQQCVMEDKMTCDNPPTIDHSTRMLPREYMPDNVVVYYCDDYYWMSGNKTTQIVTCQNDGSWLPDPNIIVCHPVTCPSPRLPVNVTRVEVRGENATAGTSLRPYYKTETVIVVKCDDGLWIPKKLVSLEIECMMNGLWEPDPMTMNCSAAPCGTLPDLENANYTLYVNPLKRPEAKYRCEIGYLLSPSLLTRTRDFTTSCINGIWVPPPIQRVCEPLLCPIPNDIANGYYSLGSIKFGDTVTYYCVSGYRFNTDITYLVVECDETGDWNPDPNQYACVEVDCGYPVNIEGTAVVVSNTTYRQTAVYTCSKGKRIDGSSETSVTTTCEADTRWTPQPSNIARCVNVTCDDPPLVMPHTLHSSGHARYGYSWTYECKPGFHVSLGRASFSIPCGSDGQWSAQSSGCIPIKCGRPPEMPLSNLQEYIEITDDDGLVHETVIYQCNSGTWISDGIHKSFTATVKCVDGLWEPPLEEAVRCVTVSCDVLPSPVVIGNQPIANIIRSHPEGAPRYNGTIHYECPVGQFIKAFRRKKVVIRCESDGRWSLDINQLFCEETRCDKDYDDPNGVWSHQSSFKIGSRSQVACLPTFWLDRGILSSALTCNEDGRWFPDKKCLPINCPNPHVEHSSFTVTQRSRTDVEYPVMSQVSYTCYPGYELLISVTALVCVMSGEWNPAHTTVRCRPIVCPAPNPIPFNAQLVGATTYNATLTVHCDIGYMINSGKTLISSLCRADRTWTIDLSQIQCVSAQCSHSGNIAHGDLIAYSPGPYYGHLETVRFSCLKGYWVDRNIRQFSSKCNDNAVWEPPLEGATCKRISCLDPQEKNFTRRTLQDLTAGSKVSYTCDPLHWAAIQSGPSLTHAQYWELLPQHVLTLTCLEDGLWDTDPASVRCLSTKAANKLKISSSGPSLTNFVPQIVEANRVTSTENLSWLSNEEMYTVGGPGDGSEVGEWIERVEDGFKGRSFEGRGRAELEEAMKGRRYQSLIENIFNSSCGINTNVTDVSNDPESQHTANVTNLPEPCNKEEQKAQPISVDSVLDDIHVGRTLLNRKVISERIHVFLEKQYKEIQMMSGRTTSNETIFPSSKSHNISALWDGDPFTSWTPNHHALSWQFEVHLGSLHVVDEVMLMVSGDVRFNITFSPHDQSFPKRKYGLIDTSKLEFLDDEIRVTFDHSSYGNTLILSNFGMQPATLVHFSFDLPPAIQEISFHAAPAQLQIVVSVENLFQTLIVIATTFLCLAPLLLLVDHKHLKNCNVLWFGGLQEGIPCFIKIKMAKPPKLPMDVFLNIVTKEESHNPIAWVKTNLLQSHPVIGLFTAMPASNHIIVKLACDMVPDERHLLPELKRQPTWILNKVTALCAGGKWVSNKKKLPTSIKPHSRYNYSLKLRKNNQLCNCASWCLHYVKNHTLTFLWPTSYVSRHYLTSMQRLVSLMMSLSFSMLVFSLTHIYTDIYKPTAIDTVLYHSRYFNISWHSAVCSSIAILCGMLMLLCLRLLLVVISKHERLLRQCGKARTAIVRLPGRDLFNLMMTGKWGWSRKKNVGSTSRDNLPTSFDPRLFPSYSTLVAWTKERNELSHKLRQSQSAPLTLTPSQGYNDVNEKSKSNNSPNKDDCLCIEIVQKKETEQSTMLPSACIGKSDFTDVSSEQSLDIEQNSSMQEFSNIESTIHTQSSSQISSVVISGVIKARANSEKKSPSSFRLVNTGKMSTDFSSTSLRKSSLKPSRSENISGMSTSLDSTFISSEEITTPTESTSESSSEIISGLLEYTRKKTKTSDLNISSLHTSDMSTELSLSSSLKPSRSENISGMSTSLDSTFISSEEITTPTESTSESSSEIISGVLEYTRNATKTSDLSISSLHTSDMSTELSSQTKPTSLSKASFSLDTSSKFSSNSKEETKQFSPIPKETATQTSSIHKKATAQSSPIPKEASTQTSIPKEATMQSSSIANKPTMLSSSVPNEAKMQSSPVPKEASTQTSIPKKATMQSSSVPKEEKMQSSSVPKEEKMQSSSVPKETKMHSSSVPNKTTMQSSSIPRQKSMHGSSTTEGKKGAVLPQMMKVPTSNQYSVSRVESEMRKGKETAATDDHTVSVSMLSYSLHTSEMTTDVSTDTSETSFTSTESSDATIHINTSDMTTEITEPTETTNIATVGSNVIKLAKSKSDEFDKGDNILIGQSADDLKYFPEKPSHIQEKPSLFSIATGRRTIFPQPDGMVIHPSYVELLSFTPGSFILALIALISLFMFLGCYLLVKANNIGPEARFLLDATVLTCLVMLLFGTSLEALVVSLLTCCGAIRHEINLEEEAHVLMKKHAPKEAEVVCSADHLGPKDKVLGKEKWAVDEKSVQAQLGMSVDEARKQLQQAHLEITDEGCVIQIDRTISCPAQLMYKDKKTCEAAVQVSRKNRNHAAKLQVEMKPSIVGSFSTNNVSELEEVITSSPDSKKPEALEDLVAVEVVKPGKDKREHLSLEKEPAGSISKREPDSLSRSHTQSLSFKEQNKIKNVVQADVDKGKNLEVEEGVRELEVYWDALGVAMQAPRSPSLEVVDWMASSQLAYSSNKQELDPAQVTDSKLMFVGDAPLHAKSVLPKQLSPRYDSTSEGAVLGAAKPPPPILTQSPYSGTQSKLEQHQPHMQENIKSQSKQKSQFIGSTPQASFQMPRMMAGDLTDVAPKVQQSDSDHDIYYSALDFLEFGKASSISKPILRHGSLQNSAKEELSKNRHVGSPVEPKYVDINFASSKEQEKTLNVLPDVGEKRVSQLLGTTPFTERVPLQRDLPPLYRPDSSKPLTVGPTVKDQDMSQHKTELTDEHERAYPQHKESQMYRHNEPNFVPEMPSEDRQGGRSPQYFESKEFLQNFPTAPEHIETSNQPPYHESEMVQRNGTRSLQAIYGKEKSALNRNQEQLQGYHPNDTVQEDSGHQQTRTSLPLQLQGNTNASLSRPDSSKPIAVKGQDMTQHKPELTDEHERAYPQLKESQMYRHNEPNFVPEMPSEDRQGGRSPQYFESKEFLQNLPTAPEHIGTSNQPHYHEPEIVLESGTGSLQAIYGEQKPELNMNQLGLLPSEQEQLKSYHPGSIVQDGSSYQQTPIPLPSHLQGNTNQLYGPDSSKPVTVGPPDKSQDLTQHKTELTDEHDRAYLQSKESQMYKHNEPNFVPIASEIPSEDRQGGRSPQNFEGKELFENPSPSNQQPYHESGMVQGSGTRPSQAIYGEQKPAFSLPQQTPAAKEIIQYDQHPPLESRMDGIHHTDHKLSIGKFSEALPQPPHVGHPDFDNQYQFDYDRSGQTPHGPKANEFTPNWEEELSSPQSQVIVRVHEVLLPPHNTGEGQLDVQGECVSSGLFSPGHRLTDANLTDQTSHNDKIDTFPATYDKLAYQSTSPPLAVVEFASEACDKEIPTRMRPLQDILQANEAVPTSIPSQPQGANNSLDTHQMFSSDTPAELGPPVGNAQPEILQREKLFEGESHVLPVTDKLQHLQDEIQKKSATPSDLNRTNASLYSYETTPGAYLGKDGALSSIKQGENFDENGHPVLSTDQLQGSQLRPLPRDSFKQKPDDVVTHGYGNEAGPSTVVYQKQPFAMSGNLNEGVLQAGDIQQGNSFTGEGIASPYPQRRPIPTYMYGGGPLSSLQLEMPVVENHELTQEMSRIKLYEISQNLQQTFPFEDRKPEVGRHDSGASHSVSPSTLDPYRDTRHDLLHEQADLYQPKSEHVSRKDNIFSPENQDKLEERDRYRSGLSSISVPLHEADVYDHYIAPNTSRQPYGPVKGKLDSDPSQTHVESLPKHSSNRDHTGDIIDDGGHAGTNSESSDGTAFYTPQLRYSELGVDHGTTYRYNKLMQERISQFSNEDTHGLQQIPEESEWNREGNLHHTTSVVSCRVESFSKLPEDLEKFDEENVSLAVRVSQVPIFAAEESDADEAGGPSASEQEDYTAGFHHQEASSVSKEEEDFQEKTDQRKLGPSDTSQNKSPLRDRSAVYAGLIHPRYTENLLKQQNPLQYSSDADEEDDLQNSRHVGMPQQSQYDEAQLQHFSEYLQKQQIPVHYRSDADVEEGDDDLQDSVRVASSQHGSYDETQRQTSSVLMTRITDHPLPPSRFHQFNTLLPLDAYQEMLRQARSSPPSTHDEWAMNVPEEDSGRLQRNRRSETKLMTTDDDWSTTNYYTASTTSLRLRFPDNVPTSLPQQPFAVKSASVSRNDWSIPDESMQAVSDRSRVNLSSHVEPASTVQEEIEPSQLYSESQSKVSPPMPPSESSVSDFTTSVEGSLSTSVRSGRSKSTSLQDIIELREMLADIKAVVQAGLVSRDDLYGEDDTSTAIVSCSVRSGHLSETLLPALIQQADNPQARIELVALRNELAQMRESVGQVFGVTSPHQPIPQGGQWGIEDLLELRNEFSQVRSLVENTVASISNPTSEELSEMLISRERHHI
ncbi:unnamed protein product [Clavelina lepadiformis]|uniref:Uncharacterized protein n=1 Tax=Clavelina lepadiformis TaxID=159417 RepID=A0ABP0GSA9_CLALP